MNKDIWTYWHQGFDKAPWLVKKCVEAWEKKHPDWNIHKIDADNCKDYIDPVPIEKKTWERMILQHRSDLIRTKLLIEYGGVWTDPTCYPLISLDDWLNDHLEEGLFLFTNPGRDRIISNWFIAAEPQHSILIDLYQELCDYWNNNSFKNLGTTKKGPINIYLYKIINRNLEWPIIWFHPLMTKVIKHAPYMVYHYKFYQLIKNNKEYKQKWGKMNLLPSTIALVIKRNGLSSKLTKESKAWIDNKTAPLFKLDWKVSANEISETSTLNYLFNN